jgi:hypothetical protein
VTALVAGLSILCAVALVAICADEGAEPDSLRDWIDGSEEGL